MKRGNWQATVLWCHKESDATNSSSFSEEIIEHRLTMERSVAVSFCC